MPEFKIVGSKSTNPLDTKIFYYNSEDSTLRDSDRNLIIKQEIKLHQHLGFDVTKETPIGKSRNIKFLKISLGLSCNYSCTYCSQRFVPNADETTKKDVPDFLAKMDTWYDGGEDGLGKETKLEFWGGEPFVYWKTIQPLAEGIRNKYPNMKFSMITNGTLLDDEKIEWLDKFNFSIGMSHDGVGYHIRGDDPLDNPKKKEMIMKLWNRFAPQGRMSINAMLHKDNQSRKAIQQFLEKHFGTEYLNIGEGGFIDAYDAGGLASSLHTPQTQIDFRRISIKEIREGSASRFSIITEKVNNFIDTIKFGKKKYAVNQKCGIESPNVLIVNLKGDVITCQNVSSVATAMNGRSHKIGSVYDFDNIKLDTVTTWQHRKNCSKCPVLHICQASCQFLEDNLFQASCENSYSENIVYFAMAMELLTGYLPVRVENQPHRPDREDIWGLDGYPEPVVMQKEVKENKKYNFKVSGEII